MEIIKRGNEPKFKVRFMCGMCDCIYIASSYEVREYESRGGELRYSCCCPECGYINYSGIKLEGK